MRVAKVLGAQLFCLPHSGVINWKKKMSAYNSGRRQHMVIPHTLTAACFDVPNLSCVSCPNPADPPADGQPKAGSLNAAA